MSLRSVAFLIALGLSNGWSGEQVTFRTVADAVSLDVTVTANRKAVRGLRATDFRLEDNGVPQHVEVVSLESVPIDLTLLWDLSGSTRGATQEVLSRAVLDVARLARQEDRIRMVVVTHRIHETLPFVSTTAGVRLVNVTSQGATALYDGLAAALMTIRHEDRRQIVIGITDGRDTLSFLDPHLTVEMAKRSDAVLELILAGEDDGERRKVLSKVAEVTGGSVRRAAPGQSLSEAFTAVLAEFRSGYVLYYRPTNVSVSGWHRIHVSLERRTDAVIRARSGYDRGR